MYPTPQIFMQTRSVFEMESYVSRALFENFSSDPIPIPQARLPLQFSCELDIYLGLLWGSFSLGPRLGSIRIL